jgi:hypothetical protein
MDDPLGFRANLTKCMDMGHDIVPQLLLQLIGTGKIDVVKVCSKLFELR